MVDKVRNSILDLDSRINFKDCVFNSYTHFDMSARQMWPENKAEC